MDLDSEELRKKKRKLKLSGQPFRMLAMIAKRNGDVVTHEELGAQFWPGIIIEDYKHSLRNSLLTIRKVLGDSARKPRYIKTVSRGYLFLVPVEFVTGSSTNGNGPSNSLANDLPAEIKQIWQELLDTSACQGLAFLLCRCKTLCNQHSQDPNLPELQLLMTHIQSAIDRSAVLESGWANPAISDEVASLVFGDPNAISVPDPFGNGWKTLGLVSESVLLVVEHNGLQIDRIRGRRATQQERRVYEQRRK